MGDWVKEQWKINESWVNYKCVACGETLMTKPGTNALCHHDVGKDKKKITFPRYPCGYDISLVPPVVKQLVEAKNYAEILFEESSKRIVNEEKARKALILLLFGGRLVKNAKPTSYNSMLSALSGSGKDYLLSNLLQLLPLGYWDHKTRLSEKALSYWHPTEREPYFTWNGRILYTEDASNAFLNSDTTKIMMTGGSDISIVRDGYLVNMKINGSPIFAITSASAEPNKELTRRVSSIPLDGSQEQTEKILEFQTRVALNGLPSYNPYIVNTGYLLDRVEVIVPYANVLIKDFPKKLAARTNFDRLIDIIKASAALHQFTRNKDIDKVIANEDDLKAALSVFKTLFPIKTVSLPHTQQALLDYLKAIKETEERSASELFREVGVNYYTQIGTMIEGLRSLSSAGLIDITEGERNGRTCDLYKACKQSDSKDIFDLSKLSDISNISNLSNLSTNTKDNEELRSVSPLRPLIGHNEPLLENKCAYCGSPDAFIIMDDGLYCPECSDKKKWSDDWKDKQEVSLQ